MEIRLATMNDLAALEKLRTDIFFTETNPALRNVPAALQLAVRIKLWQRMERLLCEGVLVAVDGDRLVGTITILTAETTPHLDWSDLNALRPLGLPRMAQYLAVWALTRYKPTPAEAYLYGVAVLPAYRRHGLALQLTAAAEAQARHLGKTFASGYIDRSNAPSLQLAQKRGYRFEESKRSGWRRLLGRQSSFVRIEKPL